VAESHVVAVDAKSQAERTRHDQTGLKHLGSLLESEVEDEATGERGGLRFSLLKVTLAAVSFCRLSTVVSDKLFDSLLLVVYYFFLWLFFVSSSDHRRVPLCRGFLTTSPIRIREPQLYAHSVIV
jgi:hypothetical protein